MHATTCAETLVTPTADAITVSGDSVPYSRLAGLRITEPVALWSDTLGNWQYDFVFNIIRKRIKMKAIHEVTQKREKNNRAVCVVGASLT